LRRTDMVGKGTEELAAAGPLKPIILTDFGIDPGNLAAAAFRALAECEIMPGNAPSMNR
jgi:hypothetical protein